MSEYQDIYLLISEQLDEFDIFEVYDRIENDIAKLTDNYNVEHADALVDLVCKVIPNIFSKQVNAMRADRALFLRTNLFLRNVINFSLLEKQPIERLFDPLSVVFQLEHDFYAMKGMEGNTIDAEYKSSLEDIPPNFVRFKDSNDKRKMSVKAFNHLNYFSNAGGVDKLINHVALHKASVDYCKRLVRFFYLLYDYISKDGKSRYIVRMAQAVFSCFLAFGDNDIKLVRKQDIEEMVSNLEVLTREVVQDKGDEMCERFCLEFSLKCFVCPILEKRTNGLVYIEEAVELAKNKMTFEDEFMARHMMIKASRWLTVSYLVKRLKDAQLIPDLFGPQAHPQLIGKAKAIVGLFASQDALDALEVDLIYNATKDPYLAVPTFELLMAVTPQLRGPTVKYLWSKVVQTPLIEFTGQHMQLIVRLARNGASSVDNALDLLWRIIISSDVKQEMRTQAMDEFITILKGAKNKRMQYLQTFFRQVIEGQQVVACLYLARKILEDYPTENDLKDYPLMDMRVVDGQTRMTRDNVLEALETDLKLLSAMMTELYIYNDTVSAALDEGWAGKGPFDVQEHQNQIKRRMDMIAKLIEWMPRSVLNHSLDHTFIDLVWKIFYIDVAQKPYASIYNDIVFDWIRRLTSATIGKRTDGVLPPNVVLDVFHRCMCSLDMTRLSTTAFDCFKVVFLCVNWLKGWTRTGTTYLEVEVVDFNELVGLDNLWEIVFTAGDNDKSADSIAMQSAALLIDLHLKLTREASAKVNVITRAFIDRVMARLSALRGKLAEGDKSKVSGIDRCVSLLLNFLTQFKHNESRLRQFITPPAQASPVKPAAGSQQSRLAEIQPRTNDQKQLVQQLAEICCVPETVAILALRRCNYSLDNGLMILMDDADKIRLFADAEKLEGPKAAPQSQQTAPQVADPALSQPSEVLANTDEYFNALSELLQVREINLTKLWTLLTTIPNNERKVKALKELEAPVPWENLLNARTSPHALLYNLQIIDNGLMAASDNDTPEVVEEKSNWCKLFFMQGGFAWLYHTLKEMLLNEEYFVTSAGQSCLVHTLGILHYFMQANVKEMAQGVNLPTTPRGKNRRALALSFNTKKELSDQIDLTDFLFVMLSLTSKIATSSDKVKSDTLTPVIEHTLFMVNSVLASRPDLLQSFYSFKNDKFNSVTDFVRYLLLDCPAKAIRVSASQMFYQLASKFDSTTKDSPLHFFMALLLANIPSGNHPTCSEFFSLLGNLLADAAKSQDTSVLKNLNFEELIGKVTNEILSRPAEESDRHPDHVVIGYLSLLTALLKERPEFKEKIGPKHSPVQLIHHLFTKCLFFDPNRVNSDKSQLVIKFKSSESRAAAYTLLLELASGCLINTFELCSLVLAHQGDTKSYAPPQEVPRKSYTGYVGLKNLGATCYMNSVMQQFFMMPELRRGFYEASDEVKALPQEDKTLVREIGRMFGWLQESDRQYYDPLTFIKSFKVHGEEVNPMAQQDAEEFFNLLCDQLEYALKDTKHAKLLHDMFAGSLHQTLECKVDPSHRSSRAEQDFFTLSLEIQNKNNLEEALDSFFQGEAIQDYMCEKCNKKVEITKRFSLERPANTMIIHLKRFKFDLFTMLKEKLYHYFQFPMRLNMKKYTRAVIDGGQDANTVPDDPYEYQLSGVVVHSGSAEMGHYYSFIKERVDGTEQWYRFDDTNVSQFDPNNLAVECFGGGQGLMDLDSNGVSDKNVYMLFYERVNRPNVNNKEMDVVKNLLKNTLPQDMKQMIEVDNLSVWGERLRADTGYSKFLVQFFKQLMQTQSGIFSKSHILANYDEEDSSFQLIQFLTHLVFDGVFKSHDRQLVNDWMPVLEGLYANHVPACKWLMYKLTIDLVHFHSWFEAFLFHSDLFVRDGFVSLVTKVLKTLHPAEVPLFPTSYVTEEINLVEGYGGYSNETSAIFEEAYQERQANIKEAKEVKDKKDQQPSGVVALKDLFNIPTVKSCIDSVLAMMESSRGHWRRFHQYWQLVREVIQLGHEERRYLFSKQIIACFIEYYMGPYSPFWENRPGKNRVPLGEAGVSSDLTNFMYGFAAAVRASKSPVFIDKPDVPLPPTHYPDSPLLPWSALDRAFLFRRDFFASLLKQGYCVDTNAIIVTHLSWEDMKQSSWFISVLFEAFYASNTTQIPNDLCALQSMLNIEDSLRLWRTALLLNAKDGLLNYMCTSGRKSSGLGEFDLLITSFLELLHSHKRAAGYLYHSKMDWFNPLRKVLTDRIKSADNPRTALTLEQVATYRLAVDAIEKFVAEAPVDLEWDLSFDLSDFEVKAVPNYSRTEI